MDSSILYWKWYLVIRKLEQEQEYTAFLAFWWKWYLALESNQFTNNRELSLWFISFIYYLKSTRAERTSEQQLRGVQRLLAYLNQPLIFIEKNFLEPLNAWLNEAAILQVFEKLAFILGSIAVPVMILGFTHSVQERQVRQETIKNYLGEVETLSEDGDIANDPDRQKIIRAKTLTLLRDSNLDISRKEQIIRFLSELELIRISSSELIRVNSQISGEDNSQNSQISGEVIPQQPIISLEEIDLHGVDLYDIDLYRAVLSNANLSKSNLHNANLNNANLRSADLRNADLRDAYLAKADLRNADLSGANLSRTKAYLRNAVLSEADLDNANLKAANLSEAYLRAANLSNTNLSNANLSNAYLREVDLSNANLRQANLRDTDLYQANLRNARNVTERQLALAKLCKTELPEGIELPPDRDCKELR